MATQKLIAVKEFCIHHNISNDLLISLHNNELVELVTVKRSRFIPESALPVLEKILRLHNELQINIEGFTPFYSCYPGSMKRKLNCNSLKISWHSIHPPINKLI